jgi:hypothetical protein
MSEAKIQSIIVKWFRDTYPDDQWRLQAVVNEAGGNSARKQLRHNAMGVFPGHPDLILYSKKGVRFVEVKRPGEKLSDKQEAWWRQATDAKYPAPVVCTSTEEFATYIRDNNLM